MNDGEIEAELQAMLAGGRTPRATIAVLVDRGVDAVDAQQYVFCALGGSDVVETGDDGRERFKPSGRLVREVAADLAR